MADDQTGRQVSVDQASALDPLVAALARLVRAAVEADRRAQKEAEQQPSAPASEQAIGREERGETDA